MRMLLKIKWGLMMAAVAVAMCLCVPAAAETQNCTVNVQYEYEAAEQLLAILNEYRESGDAWVLDRNGKRVDLGELPPIVLDETLTDAAMQRASELVVSFSHHRPDGSSCFTVNALK